jgi:beta-galactosidase
MRTNPVRCFLATILLVLSFGMLRAKENTPRMIRSLNEGWRFDLAEHAEGVAAPSYDDSRWSRVSLPHTWNVNDAFDKERSYHRGVGWYRRTLPLDSTFAGKKLFLYFEAANQVADVFVNGQFVGQHIGGYTAFVFPITDGVVIGRQNVIAVRVDNRHSDDIPPLNADFTFYGGIYRDVWLIATEPVHLDVLDHASPGVFIDTPEISEHSARVLVRGTIVNESTKRTAVELIHHIFDEENKRIASFRRSLTLLPGERKQFEQRSDRIRNPRLWSPDHPYLYKLRTEIRSGNWLLDVVEDRFGFRWFGISPEKKFLLNGKPFKLIGTNRHQDRAGMGNALPDSYHRRDVELVKATGFNFLRTAHYPQDRSLLEAADRLGLLVWQETPIVNIISMSSAFAENCERMLVEMIRQYYNHPSVVFWGYMNEVMLREPNPIPEGYYKHLIDLAKRLEARLKNEDSSRLSVTAISFHEIDNGTGFGDIPDVHGMNLYFGWYYQELSSWGRFLDSLKMKRPDRVYMVSEYGADSDERVHTLQPRAFDFSSEYIQDFHLATFPQLMERDFIIGTAVWNQFDFGSNHLQDTKRSLNQKGLFFYDRTPKDVWHYYRAKLLKQPILHIGREWLLRAGSQQGDERQPIRVFTNCDSVAFTLNGALLGRKSPVNAFIELVLPLQAGANRLEAEGGSGTSTIRDGVTVVYDDRTSLFSKNAAAGSHIAVNVGAHYSYTDAAGVVWEWDRAFEEGATKWGYVGGRAGRTHRSIRNTEDDPLFQAYREDAHSYRFLVPPGTYHVELGFVDPLLEGAGKRVFDLHINEENVFAAIDLAGQYGRDRAVRISTTIEVKNRAGLTIESVPRIGLPILSSIFVRRK